MTIRIVFVNQPYFKIHQLMKIGNINRILQFYLKKAEDNNQEVRVIVHVLVIFGEIE